MFIEEDFDLFRLRENTYGSGFKYLSICKINSITKTANNKLNFIESNESEVLNEITHKVVPTELTPDEINGGNIDWSFDSSFFVYRNADGDIEARDSGGNNLIQLVENIDSRISNYPYSLISDNSALFVVLQDGVTDINKFNVYKVDFE